MPTGKYPDRLGAMEAAELLERAHHYRMMAIRVTDAQTREGLLELAERYEALARELEQDRPQSTDDDLRPVHPSRCRNAAWIYCRMCKSHIAKVVSGLTKSAGHLPGELPLGETGTCQVADRPRANHQRRRCSRSNQLFGHRAEVAGCLGAVGRGSRRMMGRVG